jgi:hypothetical protein
VTSPLCTAHNVRSVNVYSVVNTTNDGFIYQRYSIDTIKPSFVVFMMEYTFTNRTLYCCVYRNSLLITALSQMNPVYVLPPIFASWINHCHRISGNLSSFCYTHTVSCTLEIKSTKAWLSTFFYMHIVVWNKMSTLYTLYSDQLPPHLQAAFSL